MNLNRIVAQTRAEGPGTRFAIWTQGCSRHCKGCMSPHTWSFAPNLELSVEELLKQISESSGIEGVTVLGGEPFEQTDELLKLLLGVREMGLSSIVFTGYTLAELSVRDSVCTKILQSLDVLVDGEYIASLRSFDVPMIGSSNQKFHFLTPRYTMEDIPPNQFEVWITKDGALLCNGMGDIDKIFDLLEDIRS